MQERKPGCICELNQETGEPIDPHYAECPVHQEDAFNPKIEAKELIEEFLVDMPLAVAKKVALKIVDEILRVTDSLKTNEYCKVLIPYYEDVKREIKAYENNPPQNARP
jgi:hypothetical protein